MKKRWIVGAALGVVIVGSLSTWVVATTQAAMLRVGDGEFHMRVARTEAEREQGLSGTDQLASNEALLFEFPEEKRWGMWMKDMNYPIDIVWLNEQRYTVYMVKNAQPSSYPTMTYKPGIPAKYVIELRAGVADANHITIGSRAVFDSTKGTFE